MYTAVTHSGVTLGPVIGLSIAELIQGRPTTHDLTPYALGPRAGGRVIRTLVGTVVTGDGRTVFEPGHVVLAEGRVAAVGAGSGPADGREDLGRAIIAPGLVNLHAHGLTLGPIHATGSASLTEGEVTAFKERHLRGGTTTAMSVDGFPLWAESQALASTHPLEVIKCTAHSPANVRAAEQADGAGLTDAHKRATMADLLAQGARCIGEIGAGGTLGGGMQDYAYIPAAVSAAAGVAIDAPQARALKEAVLGRTIDPANLDRAALAAAMAGAGLAGLLTEDAVVELITGCVMPSMAHAYEGMREARRASDATGAPFIVHHAAASARRGRRGGERADDRRALQPPELPARGGGALRARAPAPGRHPRALRARPALEAGRPARRRPLPGAGARRARRRRRAPITPGASTTRSRCRSSRSCARG